MHRVFSLLQFAGLVEQLLPCHSDSAVLLQAAGDKSLYVGRDMRSGVEQQVGVVDGADERGDGV